MVEMGYLYKNVVLTLVTLQIVFAGTKVILDHYVSLVPSLEGGEKGKSAANERSEYEGASLLIYAGLLYTLAWWLPFGLFACTALALLLYNIYTKLEQMVRQRSPRQKLYSQVLLQSYMRLNYGLIVVLIMPLLVMLSIFPTTYLKLPHGGVSQFFTLAAGVMLMGGLIKLLLSKA